MADSVDKTATVLAVALGMLPLGIITWGVLAALGVVR